MEPKDQLADKPKEIENGPDDGEIGKSLFVMWYTIHAFTVFTFMRQWDA